MTRTADLHASQVSTWVSVTLVKGNGKRISKLLIRRPFRNGLKSPRFGPCGCTGLRPVGLGFFSLRPTNSLGSNPIPGSRSCVELDPSTSCKTEVSPPAASDPASTTLRRRSIPLRR